MTPQRRRSPSSDRSRRPVECRRARAPHDGVVELRREAQQLLGERGLRRIAMGDRRALQHAVLDDVDEAPVGQLGDRQVRHRVDDALVLHRLGERAQLRQELQARLGLLASVDVAAGDRRSLRSCRRAAQWADVALTPAGGPGKRSSAVTDSPASARASIVVDRAHQVRRQPQLRGRLPDHLGVADERANGRLRRPVGIDHTVIAILEHDMILSASRIAPSRRLLLLP